jgi:serine protease Do/serine protease DegQ
MNQTARATALFVALAAQAGVAAMASVPLPVVAQASGVQTLAPVLKKITPAVVGISIRSRPEGSGQTNGQASSQARRARDARSETARPAAVDQQARAAGSGVVIDARQGLVLTNHHVIDRAEEIIVRLADGRDVAGKLVGADPDTDIAVIRVAADNLTAIPVGNSDQVEVGDFVLAIGNPSMIGQTVTSGIVSGLNRTNVGIEPVEDFIQTDAAIYPGHSGGALANLRGELIGINTAFVGASTSTANAGMGFAIPVNMARMVVDRIVESGDVRRGRLGITFDDPAPAPMQGPRGAAASAGSVTAGAVITKVESGSPADAAGLKAGDLVMGIAGTPVRDMSHLRTRLGLLWIGDVAELTVVRNGKPAVIRATIADPQPRVRGQK